MKYCIYSNKKAQILAWYKAFIKNGFVCEAKERVGANGRIGNSKYQLIIYNSPDAPKTQDEYNAFVAKINKVYNSIQGK